jgi:hypothetical protein
MNLPLTGGCLCRGIRYEVARQPILVYTCHCTDCQHITGSAFAIGVLVLDEVVRLSGKAPRLIESIADSGRVKVRCVCPDCATCVCGQARPGTQVQAMVRTILGGTLDDTSWLRPTVHVWTRSKQPWIVLPESDQQFMTHSGIFGETPRPSLRHGPE